MTIRSILFLAFNNVGEQDLFIPWELFRALSWSLAEQGENLAVTLGSFEGGTMRGQMGLSFEVDRSIDPAERFDMVYVPGGIGAGALSQNATALEFLHAHHREGRWLGANCAGVGVLHRAGVLVAAQVTAPATLARRLPAQGTPIVSPRRAWQIDEEHKIFTAGGAATVHASTMALATALFGQQRGRELAAGWDTLPFQGEVLFSRVGPEMHDDPAIAAGLQDRWENVFLPPETVAA